jgi:hypothetical protein
VATALGMHGTQTLRNHSALMHAAEAGAPDGGPAGMLRGARAWLAAHPGAAMEACNADGPDSGEPYSSVENNIICQFNLLRLSQRGVPVVCLD